MPKQQMIQLRFKQIAVGGPNGKDVYGLTDSGEVYVRGGTALSTQWLPLSMDGLVKRGDPMESKSPPVETAGTK